MVKRYTLRKPVVARQRKDIPRGEFVIENFPDFYAVEDFRCMDMVALQPEQFEELFVELDVDMLRQQIADLLVSVHNHGFACGRDELAVEDSFDWSPPIVESILALVFPGITERETDK
jgi:hypothetical protein